MHRVWCGAWLERMRRTSHYMVGFLSCLRASSCSLPLFPGDGVDFLSWFLNALHSALGGTKKKKKSKSCCLSKESPIFFVFAFFLEKKFILLLPFWDKVLLEPQLAWSSDSSCLSFLCTEMTYNTWFFCFTPRSWDYRHVPLGCARPELILPCFLLEYGYVLSLCFFLVVLLLSYLFFFFKSLKYVLAA